MRRFCVRLAGFCVIQLVIAMVVLSRGAPRLGEGYISAIHDKRELLARDGAARLIFVGGSSVAFGIDSAVFERSLPLTPINLGLHAGVGLEFMLRMVEGAIRPGDVVVLSPEYSLLMSEAMEGNRAIIDELIEQWPEAARYLPPPDGDVGDATEDDWMWVAHRWVSRARRRLTRSTDEEKTIYFRDAFNRYGDMIGHHEIATAPGFMGVPLPDISDEHLDRAIRRINQFDATGRAKGARVFISYPPFPRELLEQSLATVHRLQDALRHRSTVPVLDDPFGVSYPTDQFFDTPYHLTKVGSRRRSAHLLRILKEHLDLVGALLLERHLASLGRRTGSEKGHSVNPLYLVRTIIRGPSLEVRRRRSSAACRSRASLGSRPTGARSSSRSIFSSRGADRGAQRATQAD